MHYRISYSWLLDNTFLVLIYQKQSLYLHKVKARFTYTLSSSDPTCKISLGILLLLFLRLLCVYPLFLYLTFLFCSTMDSYFATSLSFPFHWINNETEIYKNKLHISIIRSLVALKTWWGLLLAWEDHILLLEPNSRQ